MKRVCIIAMFLLVGAACAHAQHRIGAGANYWMVIDDLDVDDIDDAGFAYFVSYQYRMTGPFALDLTLERVPDRFGQSAYAPQASLLLGGPLYVALGIGGIYTDGSFGNEPFYMLRAGVDLPLLFWLRLDIAAQYRFNDFADLRDDDRKIGTDTVFLGAALRLNL